MEEFAVVTEKVAAAGSGVGDVAQGLNTEIEAVRSTLREIQGAWKSDLAAPRYAAAMERHLEQVTVIKEALITHGTSLVNSAQQFDRAEAATAQGISGGGS